MKTLHSLSIVTALGLASAVYAQAQTSQQDPVSSVRVADAGPSASVRGTEAPKLVGMKVQTASGNSLGQIKDVVIDKSGQTSYAVIAYGATRKGAAKQTAVPWAAVSPMIQGDKIVMDQSQLERAPVLSSSRKLDPSSGTWSRDANVYWRSVKMRSIAPQPSGAPGAIPPKQ